ncbi:DUF654 family protein [Schizosaccharomyces japonicus yFS275]|uniref:DUF654 family protein n=1 Tax=Schizosaccharomyces japonicus (strain yFS275 / FY16936) TaxID=402676 RepID=B6JY38_SCHJY|nr:DUF654 family protein [Schizosaccharomyces japonicus yFS275]EEB06456.1 DUF654 family protein [Schizosaccharomyces japonicus yFS275]
MSTRALRRLQRQRELQYLGSESDTESSEEDELYERSKSTKQKSIFQLLNDEEEEQDEEDDDGLEEKTSTEELTEVVKPAAPSKKKKKKKKKKSKARGANKSLPNEQLENDTSVDDLERVVAEIKLKYHEEAVPESSSTQSVPSYDPVAVRADLCKVNLNLLNPELELRKLFGRLVEKRSVAKRRGIQRRRRYVLIQPEEGWPAMIRTGLSMKMTEQKDGISYFEFTRSRTYQEAQDTFLFCVQTYDPNNLFSLLRSHPFHIDTLLQVSDVVLQQGDHELASSLVGRALYAFDSSLHPLFNLATGRVRLPFVVEANRDFFLSIWLHLTNLTQRNCWHTVLEFGKLLLQLDETDPYALSACIDIFALKSREFDWLIHYANFADKENFIETYPSLMYSSALAMYQLYGDCDDSRNALHVACERAPFMLVPLLNAIGVRHTIAPIACEDVMQEFYAEMYPLHAHELWSSPDVVSFVEQCVTDLDGLEPVEARCTEVTENIARCVLLMNEQPLIKYLPRRITQQNILAYDPLPPGMYDSEVQPSVSHGLTDSLVSYFTNAVLNRNQGQQEENEENGVNATNEEHQDRENAVQGDAIDGLEDTNTVLPLLRRLRSYINGLFANPSEAEDENDEFEDAISSLDEEDTADDFEDTE